MKIVTPNAQLVGHTIYIPPVDDTGTQIMVPHGTTAEDLIEFAGRLCYLSFDRPSERTKTLGGYIGNIMRQKHFSVIEHSQASFYITGVSRSLTHELARHRHFSFSQLSQRFVDESDTAVVMPPAIRDVEGETADEDLRDEWLNSMVEVAQDYAHLAGRLMDEGLPRKKAREAARSVLPNAVETRLVVTGNYRSWLEFLVKRDADGADAEIRELARIIHRLLTDLAPHVFGHDAEQIWRNA